METVQSRPQAICAHSRSILELMTPTLPAANGRAKLFASPDPGNGNAHVNTNSSPATKPDESAGYLKLKNMSTTSSCP